MPRRAMRQFFDQLRFEIEERRGALFDLFVRKASPRQAEEQPVMTSLGARQREARLGQRGLWLPQRFCGPEKPFAAARSHHTGQQQGGGQEAFPPPPSPTSTAA